MFQALMQDGVSHLWILDVFQTFFDDPINRSHAFGQLLDTRQLAFGQAVRTIEAVGFFQQIFGILSNMFQEFWKGLAEFNGGLVGIDFCSEDLVETINIFLNFFAGLFCRIQIK